LEGSRRAERERARWETKQRQDPLGMNAAIKNIEKTLDKRKGCGILYN